MLIFRCNGKIKNSVTIHHKHCDEILWLGYLLRYRYLLRNTSLNSLKTRNPVMITYALLTWRREHLTVRSLNSHVITSSLPMSWRQRPSGTTFLWTAPFYFCNFLKSRCDRHCTGKTQFIFIHLCLDSINRLYFTCATPSYNALEHRKRVDCTDMGQNDSSGRRYRIWGSFKVCCPRLNKYWLTDLTDVSITCCISMKFY